MGGVADICIFDPHAAWVVEPNALQSQGKHTPFSGYELPGRVRCTLVGGQIVYQSAHHSVDKSTADAAKR